MNRGFLVMVLGLFAWVGWPVRASGSEVLVQVRGEEGWYEADNLAALAIRLGRVPPQIVAGTPTDGGMVAFVGDYAVAEPMVTGPALRALGGKISLNRASQAELESLPGIGPALAQRIRAGRPFRSVADLDRIKGIGPKKLARVAPLLTL